MTTKRAIISLFYTSVSEWRKQQVRQGQAVRVEIVAHEDIEHHVELKEEIERLRHAISLLKPAEQRLFRMRHEAEMDISQIASATGIGERSVRVDKGLVPVIFIRVDKGLVLTYLSLLFSRSVP